MLTRCRNKNRPEWMNYGGRGVTVCERWQRGFRFFLEDMGEKPDGYSIDRIDPEGNYEPSNCRWIPMSEQRKTTRHYLSNGDCRLCGESRATNRGVCHKCNEYQRRNGIDRPSDPKEVARLAVEKLRKKKQRPVWKVDKDTGEKLEYFESQTAAMKAYGTGVSNCICGLAKTAKGFCWEAAS